MTLRGQSRVRSIVILVAALAGCQPDDPCDPGQVLVLGTCRAAPADAGVAEPDAEVCALAGLGETCAANPECGCGTDWCNKMPGAPTGYCTRTGCVADPSVCPAGWTCLDLSQFMPGLPAVCNKP